MAQPYLSIIIPAYNEAERIPQTLVAMDKHLSAAEYSYEIIVVDNGSQDGTADIVRNMEKMVRNLKVMAGTTPGKGGAVRAGMLAATGKVRLFTDADNSTSIEHFDAMIPLFKEGFDIVIGSRAVKGARLDPPEVFYRQIAGKVLNLVVQMLLLPGLWDTQCGFKAFTDEAAMQIFAVSKISGWAFDVEILALGRRLGFKTKEIPVHWVNDNRSHVKLSAGFEFLAQISKIRWWLWRNDYQLAALDKDPQMP